MSSYTDLITCPVFHFVNRFLMTYERATKNYTRPGAAIKKAKPVSMVTFVCLISGENILFGTVTIAIYVIGILGINQMK